MPQNSIETVLTLILKADPGTVAASGGNIFPQKAPQGTPPAAYLTYRLVSNPRQYTMSGPLSLGWARFQLDAWGQTYAQAKTLANAVLAALDGYKGTPAGSLVKVLAGFIEDEEDSYDPPQHADDVGFHRVSIDVKLWSSN